ncbi:hypothetical protein [Streptomyces sp. MN6]
MQPTTLARTYTWSGRTLFITPETHRDLLRLWSLQSLTSSCTYPPGWALTERSNLLHGLAQTLGYTDYRYSAPNWGSKPGRPTGTDLDLIRLARQYSVDTGHIMAGTRLMPSSTCNDPAPARVHRCFIHHAPTGWRSHPLPATA